MNDAADKRYDATPARREHAKREGNSARSAELVGVAAFCGALVGVVGALPLLSSLAAAAVRASTTAPLRLDLDPAMLLVAGAMLPACAAAIVAVAIAIAQVGGLHVAPVRLSFAKLAPFAGLKRLVGGEALVGAARAAVALLAALALVAPAAVHVVAVALRASSPLAAAHATRDAMIAAAAVAAGVGLVFACGDYALVRRRWLRSLRMTFDELKRDLKEQDGDPQARSRRRQMHRALARGGIARTSEASFVVVNPTHVALALRYAPPQVPVPEILVRAVDAAALAVRAIAEREAIPIVENVTLARWLFRCGEAGRPIPDETFVAVAEVIAALARAGALRA